MKLYVLFNTVDLERAVTVAQTITEHADMIGIGSLLLYRYGTQAIETFRTALPKATLIADSKVIERGADAAQVLFDAGADWITVMAGTHRHVIQSATGVARDRGRKVMIDLTDSAEPGQSALDAQALDAHAILFQSTFDEKDVLLFNEKFDMIRGNTQLPIFVSAHVDQENAHFITALKPDGLVVGKHIAQATDPVAAVQAFHNLCHGG